MSTRERLCVSPITLHLGSEGQLSGCPRLRMVFKSVASIAMAPTKAFGIQFIQESMNELSVTGGGRSGLLRTHFGMMHGSSPHHEQKMTRDIAVIHRAGCGAFVQFHPISGRLRMIGDRFIRRDCQNNSVWQAYGDLMGPTKAVDLFGPLTTCQCYLPFPESPSLRSFLS